MTTHTMARCDRGFALAALVALVAAGCVHDAPPATPPPSAPRPPEAEVRAFEALVAELDAAAAGGWREPECRRVAAGFVELHERHERSERGGGVPAALYDAALALRGCGLEAEAAPLLERASQAAAAPGYAPALVVQGVDAARRGDRARARVLFERARQADPRSAEAYANLAALEREGGEWTAAQGNLRRALAVDSDQTEAYVQLALLYLDLAEQNRDMLDLATLVCRQAVARAATIDDRAGPAVAPIHNAWGLALARKGDVAGAAAQFDRARRLDPRLFEAHLNFGAVNLSFRGYAAAEDAFRAALALRPDAYEASLSLGVALRGQGRYDEARAAYARAAELDPAQPGAHYNLGVLAQDYLFGDAAGEAEQRRLLESARRSYERFLGACDAAPAACTRAAEDLRAAARRRIRDCDAVLAALGEPET